MWSDNKGAGGATRKGTARAFDHLALVHAIWLRLAELGTEIFVKRVPTKSNIADDPSRERSALALRRVACFIFTFRRYCLLRRLKAARVEARLDKVFLESQTWEALSILGVFD